MFTVGGFRNDEERIPAGSEATGRCSVFLEDPEVRGRPLLSTEGRGPSFTFWVYDPVRSRSRSEGRED